MSGTLPAPYMDADPSLCPNCAAPRVGRFCADCGQDNARVAVRARDWLRDVVENLTSFDSRILRTLGRLSVNPGRMAREYVDGRRVPFVAPFRYITATCALWWAAVAVQMAKAAPQLEALAKTGPKGELRVAVIRFTTDYGQVINLGFVPLLTPIVTLAFLGSRTGITAHLVLMMFTCGHVFLWRAALAFLGGRFPAWGPAMNQADTIFFSVYVGWALWMFHRGTTRFALIRAILAVAGIFFASGQLLAFAMKLFLRFR